MKGRTRKVPNDRAEGASPLQPVRPGQAKLAAMGSMVRHQRNPQRGESASSTHRDRRKLHHGAEVKIKAQ